MNKFFTINGRKIGSNFPPYVIAELSANHNGDIQRAFDSILAAKMSGADAVKIQTYTPETMTIDCDTSDFQIKGGLWDGFTLYELYKVAQTPYEWHKPLFDYSQKVGITIFSTPFDETAVDLLESLATPVYKIASFEMTDIPLIKYVAKTGKPMIISTGMANLDEISETVEVAKENGCKDLILLHCISAYPAPINQSNLKTIPGIKKQFGVLTGLSDHTMGTIVATSSVALGACLIEKHFTLSRSDKGPDSEFSIEPSELTQLCHDVKTVWQSLGNSNFERKKAENNNIRFRRSIYVTKDIKKGDILTMENIRRIRPGYGLSPKYYEQLLGKVAIKDMKYGSKLSFDCVKLNLNSKV